MKIVRYRSLLLIGVLLTITALAACRQQESEQQATPIPPTPTSVEDPTATPSAEDDNFLTIAADAPFPPFAMFDEFGNVVGFDAELAETLLGRTGYEYEFVVTSFDGMLQSVANREFDIAMSALTTPEPVPGVVYSEPYLEIGQVLVVLANETTITDYRNVPPGVPIGVLSNSLAGQRAATEIAGIPEDNLVPYETVGQALQALIDGNVAGVIIDHDDAEHYVRTHYEQLKVAGGSGRDAWITHQSYVIAVRDDRPELLESINEGIEESKNDGAIERITRNWLVSRETIDAGESLIGTPDNLIVIGVMGELTSIDPGDAPSLPGWEVKYNTMSGLYMFDTDGALVPVLADGPPEISEDGLEYTFTLRSDLTFPDGNPLTAEDVRWSISRAASFGSWHVNTFLKDSDDDGVADPDAVQAPDSSTVRILLQQPTSYFLNLLATPPYFVVSQNCYASDPEPARNCNGIGPYEVIEWETDGRTQIQLQANPQWPGPQQPAVESIQLRFYQDPARLNNALNLGSIDMAWGAIPENTYAELSAIPGVREWEGPPTFKSYLVFQQEDTPWSTVTVRQAAAHAVDREALARDVFQGRRQPLYSPLPSSVPEQVETEPRRDLERARELLRLAGYNIDNPLVIPLWYLNDGRYTSLEEAYAEALKQQLEETGLIQVELNGAPWSTFGAQISECNYPTFLLGWPPVGWPTRYPAAMGWLEYFVTNTDSLCSNYESVAMNSLIDQVRQLEPADEARQQELYRQIQELWAEELPTLDLLQSTPRLLARESIDNVNFDRMGLLHYVTLTKAAGEQTTE